ncbi:amidase family protein [Streptococcus halichoeri]|uniref:amidase family protein n=1 Tax=Streptococcus halichoeri TaxID=254785 RepID=UPI00135B73D1|nr:amidase family protein [Streptococcus halichoeri]
MSKPEHHIQLQSRPLLIASLLLTGSFFLASPALAQAEPANASVSQPPNTRMAAVEAGPQALPSADPKTNSVSESAARALAMGKETRVTPTSTVDDNPVLASSPDANARQDQVMSGAPGAQEPVRPPSLSAEARTLGPKITLKDYQAASASQLADWVRHKQVTGDQLLTFALETIKTTNPELNNVISLREAAARKESAALLDQGQPFYRVPLLVKGLGHTIAGGQNTNGLAFLRGQTSKGTSSYVKALQNAGFVVIGQTAFPEMGWINVTNSDLYGVTHNPWNTAYNPGGSSGGSAAGVAVGQVPIASASDGGGSTRIPASWTGLIGLHPTRGILAGNSAASTNNVSHFALSKTMEDTQRLFEFLLKAEAKPHQTTQHLSTAIPIAYTTQTPAGTPISDEAVWAVKEAVAFLNEQGFQTVEVNYPVDGKKMMEAYYTLAAKGALAIDFMANQKLGRHLQKEDVELLSFALYQTGKDLSPQDLNDAWASITQMTEQLNQFYQTYPIFLTPTTAYPAPRADYQHISEHFKPILADLSHYSKAEKRTIIYQQWLPAWTLTPFTQLANLTGTPSLSLPTHVTKAGLPLGILVNSAANHDRLLLELGQVFQEHGRFQTLWHHTQPEPADQATISPDKHTTHQLALHRQGLASKQGQAVRIHFNKAWGRESAAHPRADQSNTSQLLAKTAVTLPATGEQSAPATAIFMSSLVFFSGAAAALGINSKKESK